jgi:CheY-like chemotaxis protein
MYEKTILVIEDNLINLKLVKMLLSKAAYKVHTTMDAEEALVILADLRPALILMDIQLPGMDGLTLTRLLKQDPATHDIPVVALTAYAMQGDKQKALDVGCDDYITKPINTRTFMARITRYLEVQPASKT